MKMRIHKYKIWCVTEQSWEYVWLPEGDPTPTKCPTDNTHEVDLESISIDQTVSDMLEIQKDSENAPIQRIKMAPTGWVYKMRALEFETSNPSALHSYDWHGVDKTDMVIKCYDADDNLLTEQTDLDTICVRTEIDWEPQHDYEMIGGSAKLAAAPATDLRMWCVVVPDVPEQMGGSKVAIDGINFKYIGTETISADGRVSKKMTYDPVYHTNKLRLIFRHAPGAKHQMMFMLEFFKP